MLYSWKHAAIGLCLAICPGAANAGYREYPAAEIASIAPADRSESPRLLVRWNLPTDLDLRFVDAAVITMTLERAGAEPLGVQLHPLSRTWHAQDARWSEGWTRAGGDFDDEVSAPAILTGRNDGAVSIDVYLLIRELLAGQRSNFGFILVPENVEGTALKPVQANDAAKLANAKLVIAYRERK